MRSVEDFTPGTRDKPREEPYSREEINLAAVTDVLWSHWLLLALISIFAGVAAFGIARILPKQYEARVVISPALKDTREGAAGGLSQELGGLAALAGFAGPTSAFKAEALATLESDVLTTGYIRDQNLLPILFASKWDSAKGTWRPSDHGKWPTVWQANQFFGKSVRTVLDDKKSGLVVLTIKWTDPAAAAKWANDLVARTNDYMRQRAIDEAQTNMNYLKDQVEKNPTVEMKVTIYNLMQGELKSAMLAQGNRQFALKVIDPATPPERPVSPKPLVWAVGGVLLGFLLTACTLLMRAGYVSSKSSG